MSPAEELALRAVTRRLHEHVTANRDSTPDRWLGVPDALVDRWQQLLRLASPADLAARVAAEPVPVSSDEDERWVRVMREATARARRRQPTRLRDRRVPFAPLVAPWVQVAVTRADTACRASRARPAWRAMQRDAARALAHDLAHLAERSWYGAFTEWRAAQGADGAYRGFVTAELRSGFGTLRSAYPVVLRRLAERVVDWVAHVRELAHRLTGDLPALHALTGRTAPQALPTRFRFGAGDRHRHGRAVVVAAWDDGTRVVYKPRSLHPEHLVATVLAQLTAHGLPTLRTPRLLPRRHHGWMEFIAPEPHGDADAQPAYDETAGMWLAIAWLLGLEDLHRENVIATRDGPVLIDLEVALAPVLHASRQALRQPDAAISFRQSVAATSLLPTLCVSAGGSGEVDGGFWSPHRAGTYLAYGWHHVNADAMTRAPVRRRRIEHPHMPIADGRRRPMLDVDAVERGFRRACAAALAGRAALLAPDGPLRAARRLPCRIVFRATATYQHLLRRADAPCYQVSGLARSVELDVLSRPLVRTPDASTLWPVVVSERLALERGDVPVFSMRAGSRALHDDGGPLVARFAERSGQAAVRARLAALDAGAVDAQVAMTRVLLRAAATHVTRVRRIRPASSPREAAAALARMLVAMSTTHDGAPHWHGLGDATGGGSVGPLDDSLGLGRSGVALALQAWSDAAGRTRAARAARDCARAVFDAQAAVLTVDAFRAADGQLRTGVATGVGGTVFALARSPVPRRSRHAAIERLLRGALHEVECPTRPVDWYAGDAGLLAVCAVLASTGSLVVPPALVAPLAARLADLEVLHGDGAPPGVAHGQLGVTLAVARWARAIGDTRLAHHAVRRLAAARRAWAPVAGASPTLHLGWCQGHGGASIDARVVPAAVRTATLLPVDGLCCGTASVIDRLLDGGPRARAHALTLAHACIERAARRGAYCVSPVDDALTPSLWHGAAGVLHTWQRCVSPALPSLLQMRSAR